MEEMAHMDNRVWTQVVVPTLVGGAALIGITTLGEDENTNFVGKLIELKTSNGSSLLRVINLKLVCVRCERLGKEISCQHKMGELPYWHDEKRHRDIELMLSSEVDVFLREIKGVQTNLYVSPAFDQASVRRLMEADRIYSDTHHVKHLFVSVDPAAGGSGSKYAVTSAFYDEHKLVILGAESAQYKVPEKQISLLINHIQEAKKVKGLESAIVVFIIESNLGWSGPGTEEELKRSGIMTNHPICVMQEDENRAGVKVNAPFKKLMTLNMNHKFMDGSVYVHKDFVCVDEANTPTKMKDEVIEQLLNFSRIVKPSNDIHKPPTEKYSGKMGYGFDDHVIALMLNYTMKNRFFTKKETYSKWY